MLQVVVSGGATTSLTLTADSSNAALLATTYSGSITTSAVGGGGALVAPASSTAVGGTVFQVVYTQGGYTASNSSTARFPPALSLACAFNGVTSSQWYQVGQLLQVTLSYYGANLNASLAESVSVVASTPLDVELVSLTETGLSTGLFTGLTYTDRAAPAAPGDGRLSPAGAGIGITMAYYDSVAGSNYTLAAAGSDLQSVALGPAVWPLTGSVVTVTVVVAELNTNASSVESVSGAANVSAGCGSGGGFCDVEPVVLVEAGLSTGVFTGSLLVNTAAQQSGDGLLFLTCAGLQSCWVNMTFIHPVWGRFGAAATSARTGVVSLAPSVAGALGGQGFFVAGEALVATLLDADINTDPLVSETAPVSLSFGSGAGAGLSGVRLLLCETGPSTGAFTGLIMTGPVPPSGATAAGCATTAAPLSAGDNLTLVYVDSAPSGYQATATAVSRARAVVSVTPATVWAGTFGAGACFYRALPPTPTPKL